MTNTLTISRELAENIADYMEGSASPAVERWHQELRALLAAPVVERQPVEILQVAARMDTTKEAWFDVAKETFDEYVGRGDPWIGRKLYAEQPAPVAVVLPERAEKDNAAFSSQLKVNGWNACLDKVKELNQ